MNPNMTDETIIKVMNPYFTYRQKSVFDAFDRSLTKYRLKTDKPMVKNEETTADIVPEYKLLSNFFIRIAKNGTKFTAK
jgi:hypothetical protein